MIATARELFSVRAAYERLRLDDTIATETRKLRRHQLGWWEKFSGNPDLADLDTEVLRAFQAAASRAGLSAATIETSVNTVRHVMNAAKDAGLLAKLPKRPKRLVSQPTKTRKISLAEFDRFLEALPQATAHCRKRSPEWWLTFWGMIYFTALRRGNIERLDAKQIHAEVIEVRQWKTGVLFEVPIHPILRRMLCLLPESGTVLRIDRKSLYRITKRACSISGVKGVSPQSVRALAARQFEKAHPGAGRLILGRPLHGADAAYLCPREIVESAIEKLAVPPALMTPEERERVIDSEKMMVVLFRQLSRDAQATLMTVAVSLRKA